MYQRVPRLAYLEEPQAIAHWSTLKKFGDLGETRSPMPQPLSNVRVLDLTQMMSGPFAAQLLADLGADVIKIERPGLGDATRKFPPYFHHDDSAYFLSLNRNKKSLTLDISKTQGRDIFYELVRRSDVVIDNFRPGVLEKLQVEYGILCHLNPRIISCSITGFGKNGAYGDLPAFDLGIQALGGALSLTGQPDGPPLRMGIPTGDLAGGMMAALGIVSALFNRTITGTGTSVDISLLDAQVSLLTYQAVYHFISGKIPEPVGSGHTSIVPFQVFATSSGYIAVMAPSEQFWQKLCDCLDLQHLPDDPRFRDAAARLQNKDALIPLLEARLRTASTAEWFERLSNRGVPVAPVNTIDQVLQNPAVLERNMVVETMRQGEPIKLLGNPIKLGVAPDEQPLAPPLLGEHTAEVLSQILDLDTATIEALRSAAII